jgi:hypothetical protein
LEFQNSEEKRVLAELREKIGQDGDLEAAYREWWEERRRESEEGIVLMLRNTARIERERANGYGEGE